MFFLILIISVIIFCKTAIFMRQGVHSGPGLWYDHQNERGPARGLSPRGM